LKKGESGLVEQADWGHGARGAAGLSQGEQEDLVRGDRRTGQGDQRGQWQRKPADRLGQGSRNWAGGAGTGPWLRRAGTGPGRAETGPGRAGTGQVEQGLSKKLHCVMFVPHPCRR
jgi:hypothetical protein